jgi:hypothetical protein
MTTSSSGAGRRGHAALASGAVVVVLSYVALTPANVLGGVGVVGVAVACALSALFAGYVAVVDRGRGRLLSAVGLVLALSPIALTVVYVRTSKG